MTTTRSRQNRGVSRAVPGETPTADHGPEPVRIHVTPEDVRTVHWSVPRLVDRARRGLTASQGTTSQGTTRRGIVVDLSEVPLTPIAAPLLLLVNLLHRLVGPDGRIEVIGVSPALAGALTAFDLPVEVTVTDSRGRRRPG